MIKQEEKNHQPTTKRTSKTMKIVEKFEEEIQACERLILNKDIVSAIDKLKAIILKYKNLGVYEFKGVGNLQNWNGQFTKGPLQWFPKAKQNEWIEGNPFDLLNVCFAIQQLTKKECTEHIISYYDQLMDSLSRREQILMGLANIYYNNEQYKDAETVYLEILSGHCQCPKIYEYMAWVCYRFKRKDKALQYCSKYLNHDALSPGMRLLKILAHEKKTEDKIRQLESLLTCNPEYYRLYVQLGKLQKDPTVQINYYQQARGFGQKQSEIECLKAMAYLSKGEGSSAQAHLQKAQKFQKSSLYFKALAKRQSNNDEHENAVRYLEEAANFFPYDFGLYQRLGQINFNIVKDFPEAVKYFTKYINLNPYNSKIYSYMGRAFASNNELFRAKEYYNKALELNPKQITALKYQAEHAFNERKYIKALQLYTRGNHTHPHDIELCEGVFKCYENLRCYDEAEEWALKCQKDEKVSIKKRFLKLLGDIRFGEGNIVEGIRYYILYENARESLDVSWIKKKLGTDNAISMRVVLKEAGKKISQDEDHQYAIILMAELFFLFKVYIESNIWYEKAVDLHRRRMLKEDIVNYLINKKVIIKAEAKEQGK